MKGNERTFFCNRRRLPGPRQESPGGFNCTGYFPPDGRMRDPGIAQVQANPLVEYRKPMGWGIGLGLPFFGRQDAKDQETLHIPGENELGGYLFFKQRSWDVRLNMKNITGKRLLDPIAVSFSGNDDIFVRPPIEASITLRLYY